MPTSNHIQTSSNHLAFYEKVREFPVGLMRNKFVNIAVRLEGIPLITGRRIKLISSFIVGQGAVQLIQLLTGFFLIRWLSVEQYGQYSVAFAFQSTAQVLVELGFSGSVIALVGNRIYDKELLGDYIKAVKFFRNRLFAVVAVICLVGFPLLTAQHQWSIHITVLLLGAILANLYFSGNNAYYRSPLIMHQRLKELYRIQLKSGFCRFLFLGLAFALLSLNAWIAAFATSATIWYNGRAFKTKSETHIKEPEKNSEEARKNMLGYVKPVIPGIIYSAFSAQIAIFLISIFGNTQNIAEVGALGRLGQVFFIFNAASSTLVVPFLARQSGEGLGKKYIMILSGAIGLVLCMTFFAFVLPEPLLWIMGSKYAHLDREVGLLVLNSGITLINVLMWDMNCSRKWLWSWIPVLSISSNILVQVLLIFKMDLSTTYSVLIYTIILSILNLSNKIIVAIIGLKKTKHEVNIL